MSVRIVTDSTCDLPAETISRHNIHVVPLYINVGNRSFLDGIDIGREEFYTNLPTFPQHPTTAVPSIERFRAAYNTLSDEGASEIISIHISTTLSAVVDMARLATQDTPTIPVTVIDSQQISLGTGFLVEKAAVLATEGRSSAEILPILHDQIQRSHVFAALDTLEYLKRSGRMNKYVAGLASLLQIKPILTMHKGKPGTERVRTHTRAMLRVVSMLSAVCPLERIAVVHTHAPPDYLAELHVLAANLLPQGDILTEDITPVIGVHIGPAAVGFAVISAAMS